MVILTKFDKLLSGKILKNSYKLLVDFGESVLTLNRSLRVCGYWGVVFVGGKRYFLSVKIRMYTREWTGTGIATA